ncbi:MAG: DNA translocase FtsK [Clostridium sp.]|nr:DNA translocase FtsK [Clostridium sp.]
MSNNRKSGTASQGGRQGTAGRKNSAKAAERKRVSEPEAEETSYSAEIAVWIICAVMLIIELGNFGLCGFINYISRFFFGVFGVMEYILPLLVMFLAFFLHINEYKKRAVQKAVFSSLVFLCLGMIAQMAAGIADKYEFLRLFSEGFDDKTGGGVLCGSMAYLLHMAVGTVGTYIIIILAIILCVVLLAEISVIDLFKEVVSAAGSDNEDEDIEDFESVREHSSKRGRSRKPKQEEKRGDQQVVREDYPQEQDEIFSQRKKKSILEQNVVLPSSADKGILRSTTVDKLPENEEVHEITMSYDLPLPGQGMENITVTEISKEEVKEQAKRKVKKQMSDKKQPVKKEDKASVEADTHVEIENKTAEEVKNVEAKEVGASDAQYSFPPLNLLKKSKAQAASGESTIRQNAIKLQEVLKSFGVNVTMTNYSCGPSVTRYEMVPEQGVKVSKITGLADDIMMNLAAQSIRIEAPIPGKSAVGIEIPNSSRSGVGFRELIDTEKFIKHPSKIAFAVGMDIEGNVIVEDIAKMPHLLIAGATGSGKSVCTNTLIMSILYKARPDEVKLILVDPKQVELKVYNGIPHLLTPVVTDPKKAAGALNWAVAEMTKRYQLFSECNVRNIQGYNAKAEELLESGQVEQEKLSKMPQIVIIVDELADLMMVAKAEVEEAIVRLAQLARAAGIHLVIATQRPSVDVVTGLIKANVPSRIALSVSSGVDSRTIIDSVGAEKLLGNGDMLFYPTMYPKPLRVQGAYISDDEVIKVVEYLKAQNGETTYSEEVTNQIVSAGSENGGAAVDSGASGGDRDEYFVQAGKFIIEKDKASIGMLQRMFKIGFNRAARIMDQLHTAGVVGPEEGTKPREVLMSAEEFEEYVDEIV